MQLNENVSHKGVFNNVTRGDKDAIEGESSFYSVNLRFRVVRLSIEKQRCIPFYSQNRQSLKKRCLTHSASSRPDCLAKAAPSFLTCSSAFTCHPPRVSPGMVMKAKPALLSSVDVLNIHNTIFCQVVFNKP